MSENGEVKEISYEDKLKYVNEIAKPIATKSIAKKVYKVIKKASKDNKKVVNGLKNVQKSIRKDQKGILIFAGDITPIDTMSHLPGMCEDRDLPYCYVPSSRDLGSAYSGNSESRSLAVMIYEPIDNKETYNELKEQIKYLPSPM